MAALLLCCVLLFLLAIATYYALRFRNEAIGWRECAEAMANAQEASRELEPYQYADLRTDQIRSQFESECV